jgi:polyferredoxin
MVLAFTFNMMVLNFSSSLFLTFFTQKQLLGLYIFSAIFAGAAFTGYYILIKRFYCRCLCCDYGNLSSGDLSTLNDNVCC